MTMTELQIVELIESPFWKDWTTSTTPVNPGWWNLTLSVRDLKMWSRGIKPNRNWKVSDVKKYFNIRGNKDSLVTQIEAIQTLINELQEGDMNQVHRVNGIIEEYFHMVPKEAETFEAMGWHDPRWAGDRENVEAKFKRMYPTYTIEDDSVDYLVYSGGKSNKFHVFFLATDPAGNYHSFNAYGRVGYSPTLHHNAGPGTKGSVTQAISKKRQQKSKKGYVQQAETANAESKTSFVWCVVRSFNEDDGNGLLPVENTSVLGVFKYKKDADKALKSVYNEMKSQGLEVSMDYAGDFYTDNGHIKTTKSKLGQLWMPYGAYRFWNAEYGAESSESSLDYTGNFSGSHDGVDYDVSYKCSHDIDSSYEADIRDYVEEQISNGYDSGYESFEMSTGFYEGEIEIEGTVTWESSEMDAEESFLSENDYEKVELVKPIRTGWSLGAGIALFSVTATLVAASLTIPLLGKIKGDE